MNTIELDDKDIQLAETIAKNRRSANRRKGNVEIPIAQNVKRERIEFIGALGEVAFGKYSSLPIDVTTNVDKTDFFGLDIKSREAAVENTRFFLMPKQQFRDHPNTWYGFILFPNDIKTAYLFGYIGHDEFDKSKTSFDGWVPTWSLPLSKLHSFNELLPILKQKAKGGTLEQNS